MVEQAECFEFTEIEQELMAMNQAAEVLNRLDRAAINRALQWLHARFIEGKNHER